MGMITRYRDYWTGAAFGASLVGLAWIICTPKSTNSKVEEPLQSIHSRSPSRIMEEMNRHGGVIGAGNNIDFDKDDIADNYLISENGAIYATHSSEGDTPGEQRHGTFLIPNKYDTHPVESVGTMWHYEGNWGKQLIEKD